MAADPVQVYQEALANLDDKRRAVDKIVRVIKLASEALSDWRKVIVSNIAVGFPAEATLGGKSINASDWPSAKELAETLSAWHNANHKVRDVYSGIPQNRRRGIEEPPY
jgi:hypothetical protein